VWWLGAGLAGLGLSGCLGFGQDRGSERIQEEGPISRIELDLDAGAVELTAVPDLAGANGTISSRWTDVAPEIVHYVEKGVLHVIARCAESAIACRVDVTAQVPATSNVGVDTRRGAVTVTGVQGDVEVNTGDGDLQLDNDDGSLVVDTRNGDISGEGLTSTLVDARTGQGDIDLELLSMPLRIDARTDDGDVTIAVPAGAYRVEADAANGDVSLSEMVKEDAAAKNVIVAETQHGDVDILGREGPKSQRSGGARGGAERPQPGTHQRATPRR
jgi:hypothetical protein